MKKQYTSRDFYLASFLVASGFKLNGFTKAIDGITTFQFNDEGDLSEMVNKYYADEILVSPIKYGNALKNMKAIIRNTR